MPFAALHMPSIALTQLKAVIDAAFPGRAEVGIHYLSHDFGRLLGYETYDFIAGSGPGHVTGFGEWFFRQAAFPDLPDNEEAYFGRYAPHFEGDRLADLRQRLAAIRCELPTTLDRLIEENGLDQADLVGFTSMFFQNMPSFALARRLKQRNPRVLIVHGGANCEGTMGIELVNHVPVLDFVFSGHGLVSFPAFLENVLAGDLDACHRIDGVLSRRNSRSIADSLPADRAIDWGRHKPALQLDGIAEMGKELDLAASVPLDYDGFLASFDAKLPGLKAKPELLFETSRGCWWGERAHCTFCGLNGGTMAYRAMPADDALDLIGGLIERYARRVDRFSSVDNIVPKEYIDGVFRRLQPPKNVTLFYEVKADMSEDDIAALAGGGVREIQPGIESLATSTLKLMKKGTTAFNNIRFLTHCQTYGIKPIWNLLVGFPGETAEVYEKYLQDLPHLFHLPPPSGVFPVRFDRFSPYFTASAEYRLDLAPLDYYEHCYPFAPRVLMNMAYYFQDRTPSAAYMKDVAAWLSRMRAVVDRWHQRWGAKDGLFAPRLELVSTRDGPIVEDTRQGYLLEIPLDEAELALLVAAQGVIDQRAAAERFGDAVESVRQKGLVFVERGRVLSVVSGLDGSRAHQAAA